MILVVRRPFPGVDVILVFLVKPTTPFFVRVIPRSFSNIFACRGQNNFVYVVARTIQMFRRFARTDDDLVVGTVRVTVRRNLLDRLSAPHLPKTGEDGGRAATIARRGD